MMIFSWLALLCVIIGFVVAVVGGEFLFPVLDWFVAAIPLALLGGNLVVPTFQRTK